MPGEIDIYGVFVPTLLVLMLAAFGLTSILRGLLVRCGLYLRVWHRSLFNASLYIIVLGSLLALAQRISL
ncbi:DUF1656 domain-containing protein [Paraburkholderia fungorum]|uniref:DUF1656 domain-containing protein n=1 Tax=Paraburkholderia fungorum TaxID=134537 RepID=UPI0038BC1576